MVLKLFTYSIILLTCLRLHVEAQTGAEVIKKIDTDLEKLLKDNAEISEPSTPDEKEYKENRDKLQAAKDLVSGTGDAEEMKTYRKKLQAKATFESYKYRRDDLKVAIKQLIETAESMENSQIANSLKAALEQTNVFKEAAKESALRDLAENSTQQPGGSNTDTTETSIITSPATISPNSLTSLLNLLEKLLESGGSLFSPTLLNQINTAPPENNDVNNDLNNLLKRILKQIDNIKRDDDDDDDEDWFEWFNWFN